MSRENLWKYLWFEERGEAFVFSLGPKSILSASNRDSQQQWWSDTCQNCLNAESKACFCALYLSGCFTVLWRKHSCYWHVFQIQALEELYPWNWAAAFILSLLRVILHWSVVITVIMGVCVCVSVLYQGAVGTMIWHINAKWRSNVAIFRSSCSVISLKAMPCIITYNTNIIKGQSHDPDADIFVRWAEIQALVLF